MDKVQALLKEYEKEAKRLRSTYADKIRETINEENDKLLDNLTDPIMHLEYKKPDEPDWTDTKTGKFCL